MASQKFNMATSTRAPKQWQLTRSETINSFNNWKENLIYTLSLDKNFTDYVKEGATWGKKTTASPHRGFVDDDNEVAAADRKTKEQKCSAVDLLLGQVANYATVISRNQITKNSISLSDIWSKIREHYGFHNTGSRFLDLSTIKLEVGERAEDLYQRLLSFFEDNLQTSGSLVTHHGVAPTSDEELSPTVENVTVLLWLERLHVGLPALVKQRYGSELRNKSLASIKSEISLALDSLLEEMRSNDDSRVLRINSSRSSKHNSSKSRSSNRYCCLCRTANRPGFETHFLSQCKFLPEEDRKRLSRVRNIEVIDCSDTEYSFSGSGSSEDEVSQDSEGDNQSDHSKEGASAVETVSHTRRVAVRKTATLSCFYRHHPIVVVLDTGAESNLVSDRCANELELKIKSSSQGAVMADRTSLTVLGEVIFIIVRGCYELECEALVVKEDIGCDIIGGEPFLEKNDIYVRSAKKQIIIRDKEIITYGKNSTSS